MNKKLLFIAFTFMLVTANYAFSQAVRFPQGFVGTWYQKDEYNSGKYGVFSVDTLTFTATTITDKSGVVFTIRRISGDSYTGTISYQDDPYASYQGTKTLTIKLINGNLEISGDEDDSWNGTWYTYSNLQNPPFYWQYKLWTESSRALTRSWRLTEATAW